VRDPGDEAKWFFGQRLRDFRGDRTLEEVAAMTDGRVTAGALSFIERGEREAKLLTLEALADGYGVTITVRPGSGVKVSKARRR
jgi:transcriptional regulator with XRE-family HTH domain